MEWRDGGGGGGSVGSISIPGLRPLLNRVMVRPFALLRFVSSGLPEGMCIGEKSDWIGIGYVISRSPSKGHQERAAAAASLDSQA